MKTKQKKYVVTCLYRQDLKDLGFQGVDKLTDKDMRVLAVTLGEDLCNNDAWCNSLEYVVEKHTNLKRN